MAESTYHVPVMGPETVSLLVTDPAGVYLDATLGGGGHAELILDSLEPEGRLVALDRDPEAIAFASERLARFGERFVPVQTEFASLSDALDDLAVPSLQGALFDLGISSHQIDQADRGFSYSSNGPLDMRMSTGNGTTAADVVNDYSEAELTRVIRDYGEERNARRIARAIVREREFEPITRTFQLVDVVSAAAGGRYLQKTLSRVFQAIRIEVNDELSALESTLEDAIDQLALGGRIAVLTYHSLEDRIAKRVMRGTPPPSLPRNFPVAVAFVHRIREVNRGGSTAGDPEVEKNPRARSARLRVGERVTAD